MYPQIAADSYTGRIQARAAEDRRHQQDEKTRALMDKVTCTTGPNATAQEAAAARLAIWDRINGWTTIEDLPQRIAAQAEALGYPTSGAWAWELARVCGSMYGIGHDAGHEVYTACGYEPFAGYPLKRQGGSQ